MKQIRLLLLAILCTCVVGCGYLAPHLRKIEQGNKIEVEQIQQLKIGMSKEEVTDLIGLPVLSPTFEPNRWEYVYDLREHKKPPVTKPLILEFSNERLTNIRGFQEE